MNFNSTTIVAILMAMTLVPAASSVPSGSPDATMAGPSTFNVKGITSLGVGIVATTVYVYDTTGCTATIGCIYHVWAIQVGGVEMSGWGVTACTDRDDVALTCTNVGDDGTTDGTRDEFSDGYKGEEITGTDKETKDSEWAHAEFCARPDIAAVGGGYDDLYVFINNWVDEDVVFSNENDNTGTGMGMELFDIYVEYDSDAPSAEECYDMNQNSINTRVNVDP